MVLKCPAAKLPFGQKKCEREEVRANSSGHGPSMWRFGDVVTTVREERLIADLQARVGVGT